jgi:hypothetical protein
MSIISIRKVSVLSCVVCLAGLLTQACSSDDPTAVDSTVQAATISHPTDDTSELYADPINAGPAINCPAQRVAVGDRVEGSACTSAIADCNAACTALGCGGCDNSSIYYRNGHCGGSYVNDDGGTPLPQGNSGSCRTNP